MAAELRHRADESSGHQAAASESGKQLVAKLRSHNATLQVWGSIKGPHAPAHALHDQGLCCMIRACIVKCGPQVGRRFKCRGACCPVVPIKGGLPPPVDPRTLFAFCVHGCRRL